MRALERRTNMEFWIRRRTILGVVLYVMLLGMGQGASSESKWDLAGVWEVEKVFKGRVVRGQLKLVQSGNSIEGYSTTGRSGWVGQIEGEVLHVTYLSATDSGKIALRIRSDGLRLEGTWISDRGPGGTYVAIKRGAKEGI